MDSRVVLGHSSHPWMVLTSWHLLALAIMFLQHGDGEAFVEQEEPIAQQQRAGSPPALLFRQSSSCLILHFLYINIQDILNPKDLQVKQPTRNIFPETQG